MLLTVGADIQNDIEVEGLRMTPYEFALKKLDEYFAPKQHPTYERFLFWTLKPEEGESLQKFLMRAHQQSANCHFGKDEVESREISVIDKATLLASPELRQRLLQKEMSLTEVMKCISTHESISFENKQISSTAVSASRVNLVQNSIRSSRFRNREIECFRCGDKTHLASDPNCRAIKPICRSCGKRGHLAWKCRTRKLDTSFNQGYQKKPKRNHVNSIGIDDNDTDIEHVICHIDEDDDKIYVKIADVLVEMLIDSGCKYNILDENTWKFIQNHTVPSKIRNIGHSQKIFKAYGSNEPLKILSTFEAIIEIPNFEDCSTLAVFNVVRNGKISLLGKQTAKILGVLKLGVNNLVCTIDSTKRLFPKLNQVQVEIPINKNVPAVSQSVRRPPIALQKQIELKLQELLETDIIEEVNEPSSWVSPLAPIVKNNGDLRLCIDMRKANTAILRQNHPLPTFNDFLPRLTKAKFFSKLDIKNAFHQLELTESSRYITTFITHKGMFRYKRLLFGINCAPEIFQKTLESILKNCSNTINYIDDIVVFGESKEIHDSCLKKVLDVFKEKGILLNNEKCVYGVNQIEFLGHILSEKGVRPSADKIKTISNFRSPKTSEETRSFLGLVNYVGRFIPNLADKTELLRNLTKEKVKFQWTSDHEKCFQALKNDISKVESLALFDVNDRTRLIADASPIALGAVLIQYKNGIPRPISYAHKSLTETEKRYCQTEKEALALVWSVEKFSHYLLGLKFELETDHKPLEAIFSSHSKTCARIERWVLRLQSYNFKVIYKKGTSNIADSLSRLCNIEECSEAFDEECEGYINNITQSAAIDVQEIEEESKKDSELCLLRNYIKSNNCTSVPEEIKLYSRFKEEFCLKNYLILRGLKLLVPKSLRTRMLVLGHEGHPGESLMKRRLRERVWWPSIDQEIVQFVKRCRGCQLVSIPCQPEPMIRKLLPDGPWIDLAMDFLGPLPTGENLLVIVDYYSRYKEVEIMFKITSAATIQIFTRLGYPYTITLDNAKQFLSTEFKEYCANKGIILNNTIPYWPQQNGEVERQNRSLLKRLKISNALSTDWKKDLQDYLLMYNTTPHSTTGKTPTELCLGRTIRGKIPAAVDIEYSRVVDHETRDRDFVSKQRGKEVVDNIRNAKKSNIEVGDTVLIQQTFPGNKLTTQYQIDSYTVAKKNGPRVTVVNNKTKKTYSRNISHLKKIPSEDMTVHINDDVLDNPKYPGRERRQHKQPDRYQAVI